MKHKMGMAIVAGAGVLLAWRWVARGGPQGNTRVRKPAKPVDLERYVGKWFELARYPNRFEDGCERVAATYAALPGGLISVVNSCRARTGRVRVARGRAKVVPDSGNACLKVSFFGPFFVGDYWVLDHDDDYRWSIVGEPSGRFLWILHREAVPSRTERELLRQRVASLGYDVTLLRETQQE